MRSSLPSGVRLGCDGFAVPAPAPASPQDPVASALGASARRRLHAIHPAHPGQEAAATAFALTLILHLEAARSTRPLLWVLSTAARLEAGGPYGPGLAALGLDPARLVVVLARSPLDALAAAEMGLETTGLAGVIVNLPARLPADMLKPGKRLSLRAGQAAAPCCLVHAGATPVDMPVASRWMVASRPLRRTASSARASPDFTTAFEVRLVKNRFGALGHWSLVWEMSDAAPPRFAAAPRPPLSEPVAAAPADGPPAPPRAAQPRARGGGAA